MEEERYLKTQRIYKTIMLVIVTIFLTFIITTMYMANKYSLNKTDISTLFNSSSKGDNISNSINNIQKVLENYYLNDIDEEKVKEGAIQGYVAALNDPYTVYIPKEEMEEYTTNLMGNYVGIGIYMAANTEKNTIEVIMPITGSPAEEAGILAGDTIISVNGIKYTAENVDVAADAIKGEEGSTVKLEILRAQEIKAFEVTRKKVIINPVESEKLENNIGYIQITSFDEGTAENFKIEFEKLKNQGITSLIIDLRNNGGGLVDETLKIADYIVPKGKDLLVTINKDKKEEIQKAEHDVLIDMEIVVLVNENSASSSEILAGALQDLDEATIVGITTYGKGVIQELLSFKDGSGLKVTTHEYYTPNRNKINGVGIQPDEIVKLPGTVENILYVEDDEDTQLQKAIEILNIK